MWSIVIQGYAPMLTSFSTMVLPRGHLILDELQKPRVFLSYARADRPRVTKIAEALAAAGLSVWWDKAIEGGSAFADDIARELDAADVVIVVWSTTSVKSAWVLDEAGAGRDRKRLVPVQIDATPPPLGFRQLQSVDLSGWRGRAGDPMLAALVATIAKVAGSAALAPPAPTPKSSPVRRFAPWLVGAVLLIAALGAGWRFLGADAAKAAKPIVAVLPFTDMSDAKGKAYFAEGLAEEILDTLAQDTRLTVLGGTTARAISNNSADPDFARVKLGVTRLLEGSVRGGGGSENVKISVRLIDTANGSEIWSQRFDRSGANVAAVQEEVAQAVAAQIAGPLGGIKPETPRAKAAVPPAAYEKVLVARQLLRKSEAASALQARALANEAVALAPGYGAAYAVRSDATSQARWFGEVPTSEMASARRDAETAIKLDPALPEGFKALGRVLWQLQDFEGAIKALQRALALRPDDAGARAQLGRVYASSGDLNRAIVEFEKAAALDPMLASSYSNLARFYATTDRSDAALMNAKRFRAVSPDLAAADSVDSEVALSSGRPGFGFKQARSALARNPRASDSSIMLVASAIDLFATDRLTATEWKNAGFQFWPQQVFAGNWAVVADPLLRNRPDENNKIGETNDIAISMVQSGRPADLVRAFDARFADVAAYTALSGADPTTAVLLAHGFEAAGRAGDARALRDFARAGILRAEAKGLPLSWSAPHWAALLAAEGDRSGALTRLERGLSATPMRVCSLGGIWIGDYRPLAPLFAEPLFAAIKARCRDEINKQRKVAGFPPAVFK